MAQRGRRLQSLLLLLLGQLMGSAARWPSPATWASSRSWPELEVKLIKVSSSVARSMSSARPTTAPRGNRQRGLRIATPQRTMLSDLPWRYPATSSSPVRLQADPTTRVLSTFSGWTTAAPRGPRCRRFTLPTVPTRTSSADIWPWTVTFSWPALFSPTPAPRTPGKSRPTSSAPTITALRGPRSPSSPQGTPRRTTSSARPWRSLAMSSRSGRSTTTTAARPRARSTCTKRATTAQRGTRS